MERLMRLTIVSGDRRIEIEMEGHSASVLTRAEQTAARLLAAGRTPAEPAEPELPFGYAVSGDAGRSYQADGDHHAE
jgi:hypothetical protein